MSGTIADATRALEIDPLNTSALYHRAMAYKHQQLFENAYTDFSKCISIDGEKAEFVLARGKLLLNMDKPLEALADIQSLVLRFPEDWDLRLTSAEAYRQAGNRQSALDEESVARKLQVAEHVQLGWQDIHASNYAGALTRINIALEKFPDAASLYQVQAVAMLNLQKYDSAIEAYTSALRFDPDNAKVHLERGKLYLENRAPTFALTDFNIAIRLNPNIADAYYCRALVHQELGDKDKADADFNTAEELEKMLTPWSAPGTR